MTSNLPLAGIKVVDFSRVLAGPHCGKTLLDLGADVVKLEPRAATFRGAPFRMTAACRVTTLSRTPESAISASI